MYATSLTQKQLMRKEIGATMTPATPSNHMEAFIEEIEEELVCADDPTRRRSHHMSCSQFLSGHSTNWCKLAPNSRRRSYGGQARDTCKQTCNLCAKVNLKFGGAYHKTASRSPKNHLMWLYRPQAIKALVCGDTTCNEC